MNRIRLVWSRIWNVLSDFFVSVGLSENLSVAIFVMYSLRQLAMEFLEREELANYKFQNEFLRPFVVVMQKSSSTESREFIVRCISQMVLIRVSNVKSGWKSMFMVFTVVAADERKSVVALAFETMELMTFTNYVRCLITFTSSRFNSDVSLNAIAFLRFCAVKLAEEGLVCNEDKKDDYSYILASTEGGFDGYDFTTKDENVSFWMPLLSGLSKLTSDPSSNYRKGSLEVLFNILGDHYRLFSRPFWSLLFKYVISPIFNSVDDKNENKITDDEESLTSSHFTQCSTWDSETTSVAAEGLVDLFVTLFTVVRSQLPSVVYVLMGYINCPGPGSTRTVKKTQFNNISVRNLFEVTTNEDMRKIISAVVIRDEDGEKYGSLADQILLLDILVLHGDYMETVSESGSPFSLEFFHSPFATSTVDCFPLRSQLWLAFWGCPLASPQSPSSCPRTVVSSLPVSSSGVALLASSLTSTGAFASSPQFSLGHPHSSFPSDKSVATLAAPSTSKFPTLLVGQDVMDESLQLSMENVVVAHNSLSMENVGIPQVSEQDSKEHKRRLSVLPTASQETEALSLPSDKVDSMCAPQMVGSSSISDDVLGEPN
ncbi:hypothetical protein Nepgr_027772 [Nepenthes gracilis]|uniref:Mon2/Sec7/BIG1-like HDS domain-containing protein n=1 Tax=Nepenthes gracilis TaxID=150966 RepID=A0AAD3TAY2_NEPGR|nr:hypothetical protein Nepgr_027772 [Nepenthes gracilis]